MRLFRTIGPALSRWLGSARRRTVLAGVAVLLTIALAIAVRRPPETGSPAPDVAPADSGLAAVNLPPEAIRSATRLLRDEVERGAFPGGAVAIGVGAEAMETAGVGALGWRADAPPVDPARTMYDLASVTKIVATTSAVMLLVDDGKLSLDDPVARHLPSFAGKGKERVTIRHLLTHTSGLPAGMRIRGETRAERVRHIIEKSYVYASPGAEAAYSDLNFILLYEVARRAAREPLPEYLERRLFRPLGMTDTRFAPGLDCEACAPTGRLRDQRLYRGKPFDPVAQQLEGITGSSGLFSSARDLARFAAMIAGEGRLGEVRVLRPETVREFLSPQPLPGRRLLGWDVFCEEGAKPARQECDRVAAIGHTGYTGTSLWLDPETGAWAVLLTNRTYEPRAKERMDRLRRDIFDIVAASGRSPRERSPSADSRGATSSRLVGARMGSDSLAAPRAHRLSQ